MENQNNAVNASEQPIAQAPQPQPVQTPPQVQPIAQAPPPEYSGGKGKKLWVIIVPIVVMVLLGVGGWWYYAKGQALLLHNQMVWNWGSTLTNFKTETSFALRMTQAEENAVKLLMPISQKVEFSGSAKQHTVGTNFTGEANYFVDASEEIRLDLAMEYKKIGETFYIKPNISGLDDLGLPFPIELGKDWIEFNTDSLNALNPQMQQPEEDYNAQMEEFQKSTGELMEKIKDVKAFVISDPHQTMETPDGKLKKIQYNIKPNKLGELMLVITEHFDTYLDIPDNERAKTKESMQEEFLKFQQEEPEDWADMKRALAQIDIYAWVNTKTKALQGVEIAAYNLALPNDSEPESTLTFSVESMFYAAEPINIQVPDKTITVEQLISQVMAGVASDMMGVDINEDVMTAMMDQTDTDGDGLPDSAETMLFETDPNNPDTDGDGYPDGEEVDNGYNPLGDGELDQEFYEAKMEELMGGSLDPFDGLDTLGMSEVSCADAGGEWVLPVPKTEEECLMHTDLFTCSENDCNWDVTADPGACLPDIEHCLCPGDWNFRINKGGMSTCN